MKKKIIFALLSSLVFIVIPTNFSKADDGLAEGGEVVTNGKITFYEESSESVPPSSSNELPKTKGEASKQSSVESKKFSLPQTGESNYNVHLFFTGLLLIVLSYILYWRRNQIEE